MSIFYLRKKDKFLVYIKYFRSCSQFGIIHFNFISFKFRERNAKVYKSDLNFLILQLLIAGRRTSMVNVLDKFNCDKIFYKRIYFWILHNKILFIT